MCSNIIEYFTKNTNAFFKLKLPSVPITNTENVYTNAETGEESKIIVFNIVTGEVLFSSIKTDTYAYAYVSPEYSEIAHNLYPTSEYCYTDEIFDLLEKMIAIEEGKDFDVRPYMVVNLDEDVDEMLESFAKTLDMTKEEAISAILHKYVTELSKT